MPKQIVLHCCPPKSPLARRTLLNPDQARELEATFKILANDTRLRILHALARAEEVNVSTLAETVGMKPQSVSNQLQRLVDRGILGFRRQGIQIFYRMVDPCVAELLDRGMCLMEDAQARVRKN